MSNASGEYAVEIADLERSVRVPAAEQSSEQAPATPPQAVLANAMALRYPDGMGEGDGD